MSHLTPAKGVLILHLDSPSGFLSPYYYFGLYRHWQGHHTLSFVLFNLSLLYHALLLSFVLGRHRRLYLLVTASYGIMNHGTYAMKNAIMNSLTRLACFCHPKNEVKENFRHEVLIMAPKCSGGPHAFQGRRVTPLRGVGEARTERSPSCASTFRIHPSFI
jgi:hypothetical protein